MLILLYENVSAAEREAILAAARAAGFLTQPVGVRAIALFGDGDPARIAGQPGVERVLEEGDAPVLAARGDRTGTTEVRAGSAVFGRGFTVIAGPCAVEDRGRLIDIAHRVKAAGADVLRGGAYKPRTSPYAFQGLGPAGLDALRAAREATGLPVVTEALDPAEVDEVAAVADILQVGTRNMTNYALLKRVAAAGRPVLLKRGMGATIEEWVLAAEYLLAGGSPGVVLCERGIRTFSDHTRFTLDLSAVPAVRERSHLPIVVDPSHATGIGAYVPSMARAAAACGAHGVMIEVHADPDSALCDRCQALAPDLLPSLVRSMRRIADIARESE